MKVQLKKFPNGAHVVYENVDYIKKASRIKDHFCLIPADPTQYRKEEDGREFPVYCVYLHRDTYVEPYVCKTEF